MFSFRGLHSLVWPVLLAATAVLLLVYFRKIGVLSLDWLKVNKDALAAIGGLCSTTAVIVASILAYCRFFHGRTLTTRAELSINVDVIDGLENAYLHSINVSVKNIGTATIWDPRLSVHVAVRNNDAPGLEFKIDRWRETSEFSKPRPRGTIAKKLGAEPREMIDSGEVADFFAEREIGKDAWAVTYTAIFDCSTIIGTPSNSWLRSRTVKNSETKGVSSGKGAESGTVNFPDTEP